MFYKGLFDECLVNIYFMKKYVLVGFQGQRY